MTKTQKIKNILIILIFILVITTSCVFNKQIDKFFINLLNENFNIVFRENNLIVHFINVGQGDAIAINLPNNEILLIDTGPSNSNVAYTNYLKEKVINTKNNKTIDYLIITHADADHCAGTLKLLNDFDVNMVYLPTMKSETKTYMELENYVKENCNYETISKSTSFNVADCEIDIFGLYKINDTNESSAIVKIEYMNKSFLFMADVSSEVEEILLNEYGDKLDCDVLKVAHHGSMTSTSFEFLEITTPEYSIISVGKNSFGHPTQNVINNLNNINSKILRTDTHNNIAFTIGENYKLSCNYNKFIISGFIPNCKLFILFIDIYLIVLIIITILKRPPNKHKTNLFK